MTYSKTSYLSELRSRLKGLPEDEIASALSYYDEYFSDAGVENEVRTAQELGSPSEVAAGIIGDKVLRDVTGEDATTRKGLSTIWLVVLGVLASPIALPLAIVLIAVLFTLLVAAFAVIVSLFVAAAVCLVAGIIYAGAGFYLLFTNFASGVFIIGMGLVSAAIGGALMIGMIGLSKVTINGIAVLGARILQNRRNGKVVS